MSTRTWLPMQIQIMAKEGIPRDTVICNIPHTDKWFEFKKWTNGKFQVSLCEPNRDRKRVLHQSVTFKSVQTLIQFALLPHKEVLSDKEFLKQAKALLPKTKKNHSLSSKPNTYGLQQHCLITPRVSPGRIAPQNSQLDPIRTSLSSNEQELSRTTL